MTTAIDTILKLASREQGMTSADVTTHQRARTSDRCNALVKRGRLHAVKLGRFHTRYFTDPALADAALADALRERARTRAQAKTPYNRHVSTADHTRRAAWADDAEPVYAPDFKFTQCPSVPPPRFTEHVLPFVHGGLRCA